MGPVFYLCTHGFKDGQAQMLCAGLLWRNATDDFRIVVERLFRMKRALFAGKTLHNDFRVGIQF